MIDFLHKPYAVLFVFLFLDLLLIFYNDHRLALASLHRRKNTTGWFKSKENQKRNFSTVNTSNEAYAS